MATKNVSGSKGKTKSKTSAKAEPAVKMKVMKAKSPKEETPPSTPIPTPTKSTPKIMTAKGKAEGAPKKAPKPKAEPEEKIDAEWVQLMNQNKNAKPIPYSMSEDFVPKSVISHKVLGLGFVLKSQNNRIEVQFKDGKKTLITNYKKT